MKKLFFTLALILGVFAVNAQNVGQMWVGGSVGLWSSKVKGEDSQTSYKILPEFGYVFSENLGVGINVGYAHEEGSLKDLAGLDYDVAGKSNAFTVAPFIRYTFLKGNVGGLFVDGGVGYTHASIKDFTYEGVSLKDVKSDMFEVGFRPGVAISISDKVSLTGKFGFLGYQHTTAKATASAVGYEDHKNETKTDAFGFNFDLSQFMLGASIVF